MKDKLTFCISRDETSFIIVPDHPIVRKLLTAQIRKMEKAGGVTSFSVEKEEYFTPTITATGQSGLTCFPGLWKSTADELRKKGHTVNIVSHCQPYPMPNYATSLKMLRDYQRPWIAAALAQNESGLIGAITRYGKSYGMTAVCQAFPQERTIVVAPGKDLCKQIYDHFCEVLPHRCIHAVYSGAGKRTTKGNEVKPAKRRTKCVSCSSKQGPDITVCSMDSLDKMDHEGTTLMIIDEPHACATDARALNIAKFTKARKYGFGATLDGRFDGRDKLIEALIGPVLVNVSYKEAVAQGAISPLKVLMVNIPFSHTLVPGTSIYVDRAQAYDKIFTRNLNIAALIKRMLTEAIPPDWQTMAFIQNEKSADFFMTNSLLDGVTATEYEKLGKLPPGVVAMAKRMKESERNAMTESIADGTVKRVFASNIYVQGITFPDLRVVINLAGGGANTTAIQKPGRLLQNRPGKKYGVMIDFTFTCVDQDLDSRDKPPYMSMIYEAKARLNKYMEIGYEVEHVDTMEELTQIIKGAYEDGQ